MPEKDFYNAGIGTFIWVVTNRKDERRRGFVQLIDAPIKVSAPKNIIRFSPVNRSISPMLIPR